MVFGGQITFLTPQKIFGPHFFLIRGPKPKIGFFGGRLRSNIFRRPSGKTSFFFFFSAPPRYGVRRPNNFFDPPQKVFGPLKIFSAAFFLFSAPKTKNRLFRRAPKEQRPKWFRKNGGPQLKGSRRPRKKVAFWIHPPYEPLAVKIVLRGSKGFRVYRGTHLEGPRRLPMKGS